MSQLKSSDPALPLILQATPPAPIPQVTPPWSTPRIKTSGFKDQRCMFPPPPTFHSDPFGTVDEPPIVVSDDEEKFDYPEYTSDVEVPRNRFVANDQAPSRESITPPAQPEPQPPLTAYQKRKLKREQATLAAEKGKNIA
jgi:hypothetical protein